MSFKSPPFPGKESNRNLKKTTDYESESCLHLAYRKLLLTVVHRELRTLPKMISDTFAMKPLMLKSLGSFNMYENMEHI